MFFPGVILPSTGIGFDNQAGCKDPRRLGLIEILVSQFGDRLFALPNFLHSASMLCQFLAADVLASRRGGKCEYGGSLLLDLWRFLPRGKLWEDGEILLEVIPDLLQPTIEGYFWRSIARLFGLGERNLAAGKYLDNFAA